MSTVRLTFPEEVVALGVLLRSVLAGKISPGDLEDPLNATLTR